MKKIFFSPSPSSAGYSSLSERTVSDGIRFSREMGFRTVVAKKSMPRAPTYYAKLLGAWNRADIFVAMYPYFCSPRPKPSGLVFNPINRAIMKMLERLNQHIRAILFVLDLPIDQTIAHRRSALYDEAAYEVECKIFKNFDMLCVFNERMTKKISDRYDICQESFVEFEMLDYGISYVPLSVKTVQSGKWKIVYAGNLHQDYVGTWMIDIPRSQNVWYEFLGTGGNWISKIGRNDIAWRGFIPADEFADYISRNFDFGIIAANHKRKEYLEYTRPSKLSAYLSAGLPVIVPDYPSIAEIVNKYRVGIVLNSLKDLPSAVENLCVADYTDMRNNALQLGTKLRSGYFFKRALSQAMNKLGLS